MKINILLTIIPLIIRVAQMNIMVLIEIKLIRGKIPKKKNLKMYYKL
jgi:hypothetical protein